ncbi:hypothetical protein CPB84DRAFT_1777139 [Gymnopilus junonius]|uniref:Uncharacterized protein n=1 Tax=Gymnopilus junonius TaxID=109634 RepID=A0A9P5NP63_GYMJU|nr:hypothetical protein CPB84DRAFT_1777139 [Gymnopilus junonius]
MNDISSGSVSAYNRPSYKSTRFPQGEAAPHRSKSSKDRPDNVLSYYDSSIPNESPNYAQPSSHASGRHTRKASTTSMSSDSDYSYNSETADAKDAPSEASSVATRRSTTPSKGGADRRRVAIVEMDTVNEGYKNSSETSSSSSSLHSRRGNESKLAGLALVAPPDATLRTYTHPTPPLSAPITTDSTNNNLLTVHQDKGHNRSASKVSSSKNVSSRDSADIAKEPMREGNSNNRPPVVMAGTRTPSPDKKSFPGNQEIRTQELLHPNSGPQSVINIFSPVVTPDIGERKEVTDPVAGPVVVILEDLSMKSRSTSSWRSESPALSSVHTRSSSSTPLANPAYLHYEPGVHATAGPLPPPPRASNIYVSSPPPPRPPRLHSPSPARSRGGLEAVKQSLQLPESVTAALSRSPKPSTPDFILRDDKKEEKDSGLQMSNATSVHRREGATLSSSFPSVESSSFVEPLLLNSSVAAPPEFTNDKESSLSETSNEDPLDIPTVTVVEPIPRSDFKQSDSSDQSNKIDHSKFDQWLKENPQFVQPFGDVRQGVSLDEQRYDPPERPLSSLSAGHTDEAPSPPPKSLRNSVANNMKRFSSLPKTPSLSSSKRSSGSTYYSRTPPPSPRHVPHTSFKKIISSNPAALFCHEVHSQNTTLQRCTIYANKINELYIHDCGLSKWVVDTKTRGQNPQTQRGPSSNPFVPQPRQTSRASMMSEVTFPIRPDASTATDLSQGAYRDITPPGLPPALPYPSLAMNPPRSQPARSNSSVGSGTPPSSLRSLAPTPSTKGAGFFASLGRKASLSRKDRLIVNISSPGTGSPASAKLAPKTSVSTVNISRPIVITNPPTVPGGPRAPRRPQRSQTFTTSASPSSFPDREGQLGRRPSLFNITLDTVIDIQPDPAFVRQVDQLAALLPHADRDVLAGYLRRAGQDMLAIGQYLEDERMGTIRQP